MILQILFWTSVFLIFHSYMLYPLILKFLSRNKKPNSEVYTPEDDLPMVSVIMSVHNEEMVIVEKIRSIYYTLYPQNKFEVLVGSDNSTDGTNRICKVYSGNYNEFRFFEFKKRQGKPAVVNQLVEKAKGEILILTDAKVFFEIDTIYELVKNFKNQKIDIVGGNIITPKSRKDGISIQEKAFMNRELLMKYQEGLIWGKTIGIYGAIYAIRKKAVQKVPQNFSVDDFYITMKVLESGGKAIIEQSAKSTENVPNDSQVEFNRKVRISSGNFQNLKAFRKSLWPPWSSLAFALFSHKVLRWFTPFLIIISFVSAALLAMKNEFYSYLFYLESLIFIMPLLDLILRKLNIHIVFLRFISHFLLMNIALIVGFGKNLMGFESNVWQPTKR